jgi:hypothetical protein
MQVYIFYMSLYQEEKEVKKGRTKLAGYLIKLQHRRPNIATWTPSLPTKEGQTFPEEAG